MPHFFTRAAITAGAIFFCAAAVPALAQDAYPTKPVRMIAPFPPGGSTDVLCRLIAQKLTASFGRQVIVDNRPGAGGGIGHEVAARAPADGYTLLLTAKAALVVKAPDMLERFESLGVFPLHTTPERMLEIVAAEGPPMGKLLKAARIEPL